MSDRLPGIERMPVHYAVLDEIEGNVSVCVVRADPNPTGDSQLCYFDTHTAGAPWPYGACHWVNKEHIFEDVNDALQDARNILKGRIETLSTTFFAIVRQHEPPVKRLGRAPVQGTSVWDRVRKPEL